MKKILIINPWKGRIGPNTFINGFVKENLLLGNQITMIYPERDSLAIELQNKGCILLFYGAFELRHISNVFLKLVLRIVRELMLLQFLLRHKCEYNYCLVNTEVFSFSLHGISKKIPKLIVVHSLSFLGSKWLSRLVFGMQHKLRVRYIAVSEAVKKGLEIMHVKEDTLVQYNGIDPDFFNRKLFLQSTCHSEGGKIQLLSVIHPVPHKGAHYLIETLADVYKVFPNFHCKIIGWYSNSRDSQYVEKVERLINLYSLQNNISLIGNSDDIRHYYFDSDILIHPSESESFGYVLVEAMSFELPVIAFKVGGIVEVVADGHTGFLVEPFDTKQMANVLLDLMRSESLRKEVGKKGRQSVHEKFNLGLNMSRMFDWIDDQK